MTFLCFGKTVGKQSCGRSLNLCISSLNPSSTVYVQRICVLLLHGPWALKHKILTKHELYCKHFYKLSTLKLKYWLSAWSQYLILKWRVQSMGQSGILLVFLSNHYCQTKSIFIVFFIFITHPFTWPCYAIMLIFFSMSAGQGVNLFPPGNRAPTKKNPQHLNCTEWSVITHHAN